MYIVIVHESFRHKMFRVSILLSVVMVLFYVAFTSSGAKLSDLEEDVSPFPHQLSDLKVDISPSPHPLSDLKVDISPSPHPLQEEKITQYEPNWESIDSRPIPTWYEDAKIGIFIHWGVFSVPSFGSEWFWSRLASGKEDYVRFMKKNYPPNFTYQDFAAQFTGEFFDAKQWAKIFEGSGAQYIIFTSKHHEGFTMWPSSYAYSWNSKDVGLKRDVVGELAEAIRSETKLHFGLYYSLMEWYHPLYIADSAANLSTQVFVDQKVMPEMKELVNKYKPEVFWTDGDWERPYTYWRSTDFLAWLYNSSPVRETVAVNDRWGIEMACHHGGYLTCSDRYNPGKLLTRKWENVFTIDKYSWGSRREAKLEDFLTIEEIITTIAETVSFNGNVVLNVGPTKEGTIGAIYQQRLADLGKWLKVNGQAIYGTRPWTHCQKDSMSNHVWYTAKTEESKTDVFALIVKWPRLGFIDFGCLLKVDVKSIFMLGVDKSLEFEPREDSVRVFFPDKALISIDWAWSLRVSYYL